MSRMHGESVAQFKDAARRVLYECRLLRGLPESGRHELVGRARIKTFARAETIFLLGDEGDCLMAVLNGQVRISIASPEGREILLALLGPGEVFGEIALLDGKPRTADATAQTECTLAILDRRDVMALLQREPTAWSAVVETLCARLRNTDQQIAEIALLNLPARLANTLLRIAAADADPPPAKAQVVLSQRKLGEAVGASRESVNKCLGAWQRAGIIKTDGTTITILSRTALQKAAEGD